jgi:RND family efflux transporter MFP subunit
MVPRLTMLIGLSALSVLGMPACSSAGGDASGGGGFPAALVETAPVERGDLSDTWRFSGTVEAGREARLAAAAAGRVETVRVREGDRVAAGTTLVRLDASKTRATLDAARAAVAAAEARAQQVQNRWDRAQGMGARISEQEREDAELEAKAAVGERERAAAEVRRLEAVLADHRVRAPYAVLVTARHEDEGAWVIPGSPLLDVVEVGAQEVHLWVPEARLHRLREGQEVRIAAGAREQGGRIDAVVRAVNEETRQGLVRVRPEDVESLLPGAPVSVHFEAMLASDVLLVPRQAVQNGPHGQSVMTVVDGEARPVAVQVIEQAGDRAAIRSQELRAGARVVVKGGERLRPDQRVREIGNE